MTQQQFIEEIKQLSVAERLALIETIKSSLREDRERDIEDVTTSAQTREPDLPDAIGIKSAAVRSLYGSLKFDNPPMTREQERELVTDYLVEKHR